MNYPDTPIEPVEETIHGRKIVDNYRWLEDDDSARVRTWSEAENALAAKALRSSNEYEAYEQQLTDLLAYDIEDPPTIRGDRYFYSAQKAGQDHPVAYYKDGPDGQPHALIDPNALGKAMHKPVGLKFWTISDKGTYVSYGLIISGQEIGDLVIMEVESKTEIARLPYHRGGAVWLPDESGFYHSQYPEPGTVPKGEESYHNKIYFYTLANKTNERVFGDGMHKETSFGVDVSVNGAYVCISSGRGWRQNDLHIAKVATNDFAPLIVGLQAKFDPILLADRIILTTDYKAERKRVLSAPYDALSPDVNDWDVIIPETTDNLDGVAATKSMLIAEYLHNVASLVRLHDLDGTYLRDLDIPPHSSLSSLQTRRVEDDFYYGYISYLASQTIYHYDASSHASTIYRQPVRQLDADRIQVTQEWYPSTDGVRIPLYIIRHKDAPLDGSNKAVLTGYGGFNVSQTPFHAIGWTPFIEAGGMYAVANIRGGGEFGKTWHEQGTTPHKQQSFDDFIAAAEYLIEQKLTSPSTLAIRGASNGGLLVAACMTQRPELFGAVISQVPLTDMIRFPQFLMASRWTEDYGDPANADNFAQIIKWSPYHNVHADTQYPPLLVTTGINDTRVAPMHARKFAAALQATTSKQPVFIWADMDKGHGAGQGRAQLAAAQAMTLVFLDSSLNLGR